MKTLLLDNYDSFSHILFQYLWEINGERPLFVRNDEWSLEEISAARFDNIVISPGPGHPGDSRDFGICAAVLTAFPDIPVLGVCLGHQGLGLYAGAAVAPAPVVRHGKVSRIRHNGEGIFSGLPQGFAAVRYHSLVVVKSAADLPGISVTATAEDDGQIMGISLPGEPRFGVQFHPESIGTEHGKELLANFRRLSEAWLVGRRAATGREAVASAAEAAVPAAEAAAPAAESATPAAETQAPKILEAIELPWRDPEAAFARFFKASPLAFWLDSLSEPVPGEPRITYMGDGESYFEVRDGEVGRWRSGEGDGFRLIERIREDPFLRLQSHLRAADTCAFPETARVPGSFRGGLVGYFGYGLKSFSGGAALASTPASDMPDALFLEPARVLAFDSGNRRAFAFLPRGPGGDPSPSARAWLADLASQWKILPADPEAGLVRNAGVPAPAPVPGSGSGPFAGLRLPWALSDSKERYIYHIRSLQAAIRRGETYEACLTNEAWADAAAAPFDVYRLLRRINPAPYAAFLRFPEGSLLSASPERFLKLDALGNLATRPIKGTRPRGATRAEDESLRTDLGANAKDLSENLMIVDLMRNDFGKICALGSVRAPDLMRVEAHPTVFQLVSTVEGKLADGVAPLEAVRACFPGGSMTGAPKLRTMELLEALENRPRGAFSGAFGYLGWDGALDLGMVIRTLVHRKGRYSVGCGGAILAESDPEAEFDEAMLKASAPLAAVELAVFGEAGPWKTGP